MVWNKVQQDADAEESTQPRPENTLTLTYSASVAAQPGLAVVPFASRYPEYIAVGGAPYDGKVGTASPAGAALAPPIIRPTIQNNFITKRTKK